MAFDKTFSCHIQQTFEESACFLGLFSQLGLKLATVSV